LSGFIDAEGCFSCAKGTSMLRFTLTQTKNTYSMSFLGQLKALFGSGSISQNTETQETQEAQFSLQKHSSLLKLISYLNTFPLHSNKIISYKR